jgi:hypothetical protein
MALPNHLSMLGFFSPRTVMLKQISKRSLMDFRNRKSVWKDCGFEQRIDAVVDISQAGDKHGEAQPRLPSAGLSDYLKNMRLTI